ncbi:hypothetical protein JCM14635_05620 [Megalodesulfovibrio paquesii]
MPARISHGPEAADLIVGEVEQLAGLLHGQGQAAIGVQKALQYIAVVVKDRQESRAAEQSCVLKLEDASYELVNS